MKKLVTCLVVTLVAAAAYAEELIGTTALTEGRPGSDEYVQDGLVAHWDAIDNTLKDGVRLHDAAATTWCDLSGNGNDVAIPPFVKVEANALFSQADRNKKPDTAATAKIKYPTLKTLKGLQSGSDAPPFTVEVVA